MPYHAYRFFGFAEDGTKEMFGLIKAKGAIEAMTKMGEAGITGTSFKDYFRIEIERGGEWHDNGRFTQ